MSRFSTSGRSVEPRNITKTQELERIDTLYRLCRLSRNWFLACIMIHGCCEGV